MTVTFKRIHPSATLPSYAHPGDAGMDLSACEATTIMPGTRALIATGLTMELPPHTEAQIRPRSGLALKHGITVLNSPGTIDEGYRGELKILLINHSTEPFDITPGMRIAQMVITPLLQATIHEAPTLSTTTRNTNGFGSTGP